MAWATANLIVLHKMNPVAHGCLLHREPTVIQFAPGWSDHLCLFTGINCGEWPPKSCLCDLYTVHYSTKRTSADVCLNKSLGSYMQLTLNIMSWCMVSIAIPNVDRVKSQILLCSNRLSIPTSIYMTQLASMWSIFCNIQHLVNQQSQH